MGKVNNLQDRLFMMAGWFTDFAGKGGEISAAEAQFMSAQLRACAEQARANELHHDYLVDQLAEVEMRASPPPEPSRRRVFDVIDGGRA